MNDCHITEDMLNAIPDEWKNKVEDIPDKYQGPSEEELKVYYGDITKEIEINRATLVLEEKENSISIKFYDFLRKECW